MASEDYQRDVAYDVWRRGGNPDLVDRDNVDGYAADGYSTDEAGYIEWKRQRWAIERRREEGVEPYDH